MPDFESQPPQTIDLRDASPFSQELFEEDLELLQRIFGLFRDGTIQKGEDFVFPKGFFSKKEWTSELEESAITKVFSAVPGRARNRMLHSGEIANFTFYKGRIGLTDDAAEELGSKSMELTFVVGNEGDDAALTTNEITEDKLQELFSN